MKLKRLGIILLIVLVAVVAFQYLRTETATERAYRECGLWGLDRSEIARLLHDVARSPLTREQQTELYESTAKDGDDVKPCLPCVEAVMDAAGVE